MIEIVSYLTIELCITGSDETTERFVTNSSAFSSSRRLRHAAFGFKFRSEVWKTFKTYAFSFAIDQSATEVNHEEQNTSQWARLGKHSINYHAVGKLIPRSPTAVPWRIIIENCKRHTKNQLLTSPGELSTTAYHEILFRFILETNCFYAMTNQLTEIWNTKGNIGQVECIPRNCCSRVVMTVTASWSMDSLVNVCDDPLWRVIIWPSSLIASLMSRTRNLQRDLCWSAV